MMPTTELYPETTPHVMTHPEHLPKRQKWLFWCRECHGRGTVIQGGLAGYAAHYVVVHCDLPDGEVVIP